MFLQMSYLRAWRKRKQEMEQLLRDSGSDEDLLREDASGSEDVPQRSSSSGDHIPSSISNSDSGPEPLDWSDFETDQEYCSTDSETEQPDEGHGGSSFEEDLRQWAVHNKTTHRSLNELLLILRKQGHLLPLDARTLLATPQHNTTEDKCGGQYAYYGLEKGICRFLAQAEAMDVNLIVNIDGIPLFNSLFPGSSTAHQSRYGHRLRYSVRLWHSILYQLISSIWSSDHICVIYNLG